MKRTLTKKCGVIYLTPERLEEMHEGYIEGVYEGFDWLDYECQNPDGNIIPKSARVMYVNGTDERLYAIEVNRGLAENLRLVERHLATGMTKIGIRYLGAHKFPLDDYEIYVDESQEWPSKQ